jgi:hypothetical protein
MNLRLGVKPWSLVMTTTRFSSLPEPRTSNLVETQYLCQMPSRLRFQI